MGPLLGLPGSAYDLDKLIYLGSTDGGDSYIFYTKGEMGLDTLQKLRLASGLRFGAQSVGHPVYITARLFAYFLDLKDPKFVTGYTNPEIDVALRTASWMLIRARRRAWPREIVSRSRNPLYTSMQP